MSFPILASVLETYSRHVRVEDSEAYCGPRFIVAIVRPFTVGEDAIALWIHRQDDTRLLDIVPMSDGRDYIVFERLYVSQSVADARLEADAYLKSVLSMIPKQHDTNDTRKCSQ